MAENSYTPLPETRKDLGYNWTERNVVDVLNDFRQFLERNNARAYSLDVYATNDRVYRNIVIQLPERSEVFSAENIHIQFDRDEGSQLTLSRTEE